MGLLPLPAGPWLLDYITLAVLLVLALGLLAVGTYKEGRRRRGM